MLETLEFDLAISYTSKFNDTALQISNLLDDKFNVYNYVNFIRNQTGLKVQTIARQIFSEKPTIILLSDDWSKTQMTLLELQMLKENPSKKLVIDCYSSAVTRQSLQGLTGLKHAPIQILDNSHRLIKEASCLLNLKTD